ncbi:threonine synthase [Symbiobacterium terraclitae]|uniref:Threonine synthase n=1 Tax=Symbiobacterium terraclitae TaxID=557451 RepID=A0ABS4JSZ9_9FIRM|nr:threonine synthase [Symbiobacterium terraclitae]MBP2018658.1 threonine synthase [Symbiobacterium terraclitae]
MARWQGVIRQYQRFLPVSEATPVVTLLEGNTPLVPAPRLGAQLGLDLYLKFEGMNPTGSFKDRGMTMAMSKAVEAGAKAVICASTGNTSAAAAAYAARAGLPCFVVIPDGAVAMGKLAQALMYGARTIQIEGNFDDGLRLVRRLAQEHPEIALVNSVNPYRLQGQKTAAFEVVDALGGYPDFLAIPVGNAGNITAYWMGFKEYAAAGVGAVESCSSSGAPAGAVLPRLLGIQAAGAAPLVNGGEVDDPQTVGTAIKIGRPATRQGAIDAVRESGGAFWSVTDEEMLAAYRRLAATEGVFAEPASCASVAGLIKLSENGYFEGRAGGFIDGTQVPAPEHRPFTGRGGRPKVVAVLTGHGLKDPDTAIRVSVRPEKLPADYGRLERLVLGG